MMKMNWGHGVMIGFILFAVFILSLVFRSIQHDVALVTEDYYAQEVAYQDRIDALANASAIKSGLTIANVERGLLISYPPHFDHTIENGEVIMFRPSDQELDRSFALQLDENNEMLIQSGLITPGWYSINLSWTEGEKDYFITQKLLID